MFVCHIETITYNNYQNRGLDMLLAENAQSYSTTVIKLTCPKLPVSRVA